MGYTREQKEVESLKVGLYHYYMVDTMYALMTKQVKSTIKTNANLFYKKYYVVGGRGRGGFVKNIMSL